jgi:hypothetical protein
MKDGYIFVVGNPKGRNHMAWQDNIKVDLTEYQDVDCSSGSAYSSLVGSCEHCNTFAVP